MKSYIDESAERMYNSSRYRGGYHNGKNNLRTELNSCIVSENEIADDASPELTQSERKNKKI